MSWATVTAGPSVDMLRICSGWVGARMAGTEQHKVLAPGWGVEGSTARPASPQLGGPLEAEVHLRCRISEVIADLPLGQQDVERHNDGARLEDPVVRDREGREVGARQGDPVAGPDAARDQAVRDLAGGRVELAVSEPG